MKTHKLGIIGVGHVGSAVLASAVSANLFSEIITLDTREAVAYGQALDHAHISGLMSSSHTNIKSGNYDDLVDADIIVIAATYMYKEGKLPALRQDLLKNNAPIVRQIMSDISQRTKEPLLIFITNPLDTVVYMAACEFDYPVNKVIGTGCMLDTARLRYTLANHYRVDPKAVTAYMLAEHGMTAFPALSHIMIGGIPYRDFIRQFESISPLLDEDVKKNVVQSAYDVFHAKNGVTDAAIGKVAIELAKNMLLDEKAIQPVATLLVNGEYGTQEPIALSTPCIIGKNGIEKILTLTLDEQEQQWMQESITCIQQSIQFAQSLNNAQ